MILSPRRVGANERPRGFRRPVTVAPRVPQHPPRRDTNPPDAGELMRVIRMICFSAGCDPDWHDFLEGRAAIYRFFDRRGRFDPEARDFAVKLLAAKLESVQRDEGAVVVRRFC